MNQEETDFEDDGNNWIVKKSCFYQPSIGYASLYVGTTFHVVAKHQQRLTKSGFPDDFTTGKILTVVVKNQEPQIFYFKCYDIRKFSRRPPKEENNFYYVRCSEFMHKNLLKNPVTFEIEENNFKGERLIGRKIKKNFKTDIGDKWYEGTITEFNPFGSKYVVVYIDNTVEELKEISVLQYLRC